MEAIRRFWRQPSTHYRNFQIAFAILALHFLIPAAVYLGAPSAAVEQFSALNRWLGGEAYRMPEVGADLFRYLAVAYVAALGTICIWMQRDLRARSTALVPLVLLKGFAALLWAGGYLAGPGAPAMGAAAILDLAVCAAFVGFTVAAREDIRRLSDRVLIPRPTERSELGWTGFEQRWVESILAATLPPRPEEDVPGFAEVELGEFWEQLSERAPLHFRLGLRLSTWVVTFWPIATFRSARSFHGLSADDRDEVLRSIEHSKFFLFRQVTFVFKTTAGFAYFRDPAMQRRFPGAYRRSFGGGGETDPGGEADPGADGAANGEQEPASDPTQARSR